MTRSTYWYQDICPCDLAYLWNWPLSGAIVFHKHILFQVSDVAHGPLVVKEVLMICNWKPFCQVVVQSPIPRWLLWPVSPLLQCESDLVLLKECVGKREIIIIIFKRKTWTLNLSLRRYLQQTFNHVDLIISTWVCHSVNWMYIYIYLQVQVLVIFFN